MKTIINHKDPEIQFLIMQWLSREYGVNGDESDMTGQELSKLLPDSEWIKLEIDISDKLDYWVELDKDLKFIEDIDNPKPSSIFSILAKTQMMFY
jgi:hypothetical protein